MRLLTAANTIKTTAKGMESEYLATYTIPNNVKKH